jgi:aspartyl-tRNA(Asn)/glutamyl-tRNA(Gln) amidotransferase subunit A
MQGGYAPPRGGLGARVGSGEQPLPHSSRPARGIVSATIDTLGLSAEDAIELVERREVSAEELHAAYRAVIGERDPELHAYLHVESEACGTSIPIALKDVITTKGIPTTAGSRILERYVPVFDATVAERCADAGLTLLGKTNTDEFAMGSSTENSAYGPSLNPWDTSRVPGGSGGGTAAAVSAGLAPWGLGSDTGGSIKQPSALCGNVGLRPTYGTVSRYGIVAFASSLDQIGPVAKTVRDTALLYSIIAGRDRRDSTTVELAEPVRLPTTESLDGVRIGVPREVAGLDGIEPGVRASFEHAIEVATALGADVGECELPLSFRYGVACYYLIAPAEASSNLARYDGVRYGLRVDGDTYVEMVERSRDAGFGDEPKRRIMLGTYALSAGYYDAYYGQAQRVRTLIIREHRAALDRFDVIATPTSPIVAFPIGAKAADPLAMYACDLLTIPSCLAGLPGLNVPCGLSEGLPVGLQLLGRQFGENTLFDVGHALERALGFDVVPARLRG